MSIDVRRRRARVGAEDQLGRAAADVDHQDRRLEPARAGAGPPRRRPAPPPRRRTAPPASTPSRSRDPVGEDLGVARRRASPRWRRSGPRSTSCSRDQRGVLVDGGERARQRLVGEPPGARRRPGRAAPSATRAPRRAGRSPISSLMELVPQSIAAIGSAIDAPTSTHGPSAHHAPSRSSTSSPSGLTPGPAASAWAASTCRHLTRSGIPPAETPAISGTSPSSARCGEVGLVRRAVRRGEVGVVGAAAPPSRASVPSPRACRSARPRAGRSGSRSSGTACRRAAAARWRPRRAGRTGSGARPRGCRAEAGPSWASTAARSAAVDRRGQLGALPPRYFSGLRASAVGVGGLPASSTDRHSVGPPGGRRRRGRSVRGSVSVACGRQRLAVLADHDVRRLARASRSRSAPRACSLDVGRVASSAAFSRSSSSMSLCARRDLGAQVAGSGCAAGSRPAATRRRRRQHRRAPAPAPSPGR